MEQFDYSPMLPDPPEDLVLQCLKQGGFKKEYLVYKAAWGVDPLTNMKQQVVEVACSRCGKHFEAEKVVAGSCHNSYRPAPFGWHNPVVSEPVISGMATLCPVCREAAETVHVGQFRDTILDYEYITQMITLEGYPGTAPRLALLEWKITRSINKAGEVQFTTDLWTAWVVEEKKIVRIKGYKRFMSACTMCRPYQLKTFLDDYDTYRQIYPWKPELLIGTTAENCKLDRYIAQGGESLVAYLACWRKHSNLENLIVQGCGKLVEQWIKKDQYYANSYSRHRGIPTLKQIDWKESKPNRMLHLSKEEFRTNRKKLSADMLQCVCAVRKAGIEMSIDRDWPVLKQYSNYWVADILSMNEPRWFWKTVAYLGKRTADLSTYKDYIKMAKENGKDVENQQVRFPKDLKRAHDEEVKQYKHKVTKALVAAFAARYEHLQQYSWEKDGIMIRPARDENELVVEGKILSHCVATYAESHAKGNTAIFFIRKVEQPEEPWYTLEFKEDRLLVNQNRGKHNCKKTPEVQAFEDAWLEHVKEIIEHKNRRKSA